MSMPENPERRDFGLRINLEGKVDSDTIASSIRDLIRALRDIEENVTHAPSRIEWRWAGDPAVTAVASPNGVPAHVLDKVTREARLGFVRVKEAGGKAIQWPETFGRPAKGAIKQFVKRLAPKETLELQGEAPAGRLEAIEVHVLAREPVQPLIIDHVMLAEELGTARPHSERASIDGVLDLISVRGGTVRFEITEHVTGRKVSCSIGDALLKAATKALGKRVVAEGTLHYRPDGTPRQLTDITGMWPRPAAIPIEKLRGSVPNLTGGLSAEDYVRHIRGRRAQNEEGE